MEVLSSCLSSPPATKQAMHAVNKPFFSDQHHDFCWRQLPLTYLITISRTTIPSLEPVPRGTCCTNEANQWLKVSLGNHKLNIEASQQLNIGNCIRTTRWVWARTSKLRSQTWVEGRIGRIVSCRIEKIRVKITHRPWTWHWRRSNCIYPINPVASFFFGGRSMSPESRLHI